MQTKRRGCDCSSSDRTARSDSRGTRSSSYRASPTRPPQVRRRSFTHSPSNHSFSGLSSPRSGGGSSRTCGWATPELSLSDSRSALIGSWTDYTVGYLDDPTSVGPRTDVWTVAMSVARCRDRQRKHVHGPTANSTGLLNPDIVRHD